MNQFGKLCEAKFNCARVSSCSHSQILVGVCLTQLTSAQESDCIDADAMANYTSDLFDGIWYDVAKVKSSCKLQRSCMYVT